MGKGRLRILRSGPLDARGEGALAQRTNQLSAG
jgi:hypothetical protein